MYSERLKHYLLNIPELDKQHAHLIKEYDMIRELITLRTDYDGELHVLYDAMVTHFEYEEEFMEKIEFPFIEHHKRAHAHLLSKLKKHLDKDHSHVSDLDRHFINDLEEIVVKHIDSFDMQIADFIKNK